MKRWYRWGLVVITAMVVVPAAASTLPIGSGALAAGSSSVSTCDSDGFTYKYTIDTSGNVTTVAASGIASTCAGGTLRVTLTDSAGTSIGSGSVALPASGFTGAASVSVAPQPASNLVKSNYATIEGP